MNTQEPNPFADGGTSPPYSKPTTSAWSIASLITSLLAPVFSCLCVPTLVLAITAIVCGHKARGQIRNSNGSKTGLGMATTGLVFGYLLLATSAIMLPSFIAGLKEAHRRANDPTIDNAPAGALREAERLIRSDSHGLATGNSPRAVELAREFNSAMQEIREELFSEGEGMDLTQGRFVTYCELHDDSCLFLSQAPMLRKFEDDAKDQLGALAWSVARQVTQDDLDPTDRLGVGLKGLITYGQVRIGNHRDEDRPNDMRNEKQDLSAFFPSDQDIIDPLAVEDLKEPDDGLIDIDIVEPAEQ